MQCMIQPDMLFPKMKLKTMSNKPGYSVCYSVAISYSQSVGSAVVQKSPISLKIAVCERPIVNGSVFAVIILAFGF